METRSSSISTCQDLSESGSTTPGKQKGTQLNLSEKTNHSISYSKALLFVDAVPCKGVQVRYA